MCLAVPGLVEDVSDEDGLLCGTVNFDGVYKRVCLACTPEITPGEYVLVHAGLAIAGLDRQAAERLLAEIERAKP